MTVPTTVILKRAPNSQVRVGITTFNEEQRLDIREYRMFDGKKEYGPTKHGVTIPLHIAADFGVAVSAMVAALPHKVVDLSNATRWVICRQREDAQFHKKNVFASESEALEKTPPDGYNVYKLLVGQGAVVKCRRVASRANGKWTKVL